MIILKNHRKIVKAHWMNASKRVKKEWEDFSKLKLTIFHSKNCVLWIKNRPFFKISPTRWSFTPPYNTLPQITAPDVTNTFYRPTDCCDTEWHLYFRTWIFLSSMSLWNFWSVLLPHSFESLWLVWKINSEQIWSKKNTQHLK